MKLLYQIKKEDYPVGSKFTLPVGIRKAKFRTNTANIWLDEIFGINSTFFNQGSSIEFPTVNCKSPCSFTIRVWDESAVSLFILIEELGGIPDPDYFAETAPLSEGGESDGSTQ